MKKQTVFCTLLATLLAASLVSCARDVNENGSDMTDNTETITETQIETSSSEETRLEGQSESSSESQTESVTTEDQKAPIEEDLFVVKSDTGTSLNLIVKYSVENNADGSKTVLARIGLESGALSVTARSNSNYLRIGDETYYFSTEAINYKGDAKTTFDFGSHSFTLPAGKDSFELEAVWYFNGVYSDKPIAAINIDTKIEL